MSVIMRRRRKARDGIDRNLSVSLGHVEHSKTCGGPFRIKDNMNRGWRHDDEESSVSRSVAERYVTHHPARAPGPSWNRQPQRSSARDTVPFLFVTGGVPEMHVQSESDCSIVASRLTYHRRLVNVGTTQRRRGFGVGTPFLRLVLVATWAFFDRCFGFPRLLEHRASLIPNGTDTAMKNEMAQFCILEFYALNRMK